MWISFVWKRTFVFLRIIVFPCIYQRQKFKFLKKSKRDTLMDFGKKREKWERRKRCGWWCKLYGDFDTSRTHVTTHTSSSSLTSLVFFQNPLECPSCSFSKIWISAVGACDPKNEHVSFPPFHTKLIHLSIPTLVSLSAIFSLSNTLLAFCCSFVLKYLDGIRKKGRVWHNLNDHFRFMWQRKKRELQRWSSLRFMC